MMAADESDSVLDREALYEILYKLRSKLNRSELNDLFVSSSLAVLFVL